MQLVRSFSESGGTAHAARWRTKSARGGTLPAAHAAGAIYHVTSRGDRREEIFLNDADRIDWLEVLGIVCARFNWVVHAFCQMTNHYHLLLETPDGNLSLGMRHLNGLYTQRFNRRHGLVGHLFQGRYKAILVQKEVHLFGAGSLCGPESAASRDDRFA